MISEYILFGLVLPVVILWGIRKENRLEEAQLLDKKDTSVLRGISAFFVIAAHYTGWVEKLTGGTNAIFKGLIGQLGGIGVLIFFFVSGYGLYESYGNREVDYRYLLKRLRGVYLPYVLMKLVLLLIEYLCHYDEIHIWKRLFGILLVEDWFIHVIVIQYLVFYVAKKISGRYVVLISILADIGLTVIYVLQEKPIGWFNALWLFTFGLAASQLQPKLVNMIRKRKWLMMAGTFLLFVILGGLFAINKGAAYANVLKPLSGIFLCLFHPDSQSFDPPKDQPAVKRCQPGTGGFYEKTQLLTDARTVCYQKACKGIIVSTQEFGSAVYYHISSQFQRVLKIRGEKGVVHD